MDGFESGYTRKVKTNLCDNHPKIYLAKFDNIQNMKYQTPFHIVGNCGKFW
jgi:hypothetical protein